MPKNKKGNKKKGAPSAAAVKPAGIDTSELEEKVEELSIEDNGKPTDSKGSIKETAKKNEASKIADNGPEKKNSITISNENKTKPPQTIEKSNIASSAPEQQNLNAYSRQILEDVVEQKRIKKSYCQLGSECEIMANHFHLKCSIDTVYHYDIHAELIDNRPPLPNQKERPKFKPLNLQINRFVMEEAKKQVPILKNVLVAYDGSKNLFTRRRINVSDEESFIVNYSESSYRFKIKPAMHGSNNAIDMTTIQRFYEGKITYIPQDCIMVIETILRHIPSLEFVPVRRNFHINPKGRRDMELYQGLILWNGYSQGINIGQNNLFLNVDIHSIAFYPEGELLDYMDKLLYTMDANLSKRLRDSDIHILNRELKGLKVFVKHTKFVQHKTIRKLTSQSPSEITFNTDDGETSVFEYFKKTYNITLKYPNLPCLDVGTGQRPIHWPIEMCFIKENQPYKRKLGTKHVQEIQKRTAIKPNDRFNGINNMLRQMIQLSQPLMKEFGILINQSGEKIIGRVLSSPQITYKNDRSNDVTQTNVRDGAWNMREHKHFLQPSQIDNLVFAVFGNPKFNLDNFIQDLKAKATELGMHFANQHRVLNLRFNDTAEILKSKLVQFHHDAKYVIAIMSKDTDYGGIKKLDSELKITTQCLKQEKLFRYNAMYLTNVLLKMNAKLGGTNSYFVKDDTLEILKKPCMMMGADVNHAAPDSTNPSVSAVVGSMDFCLSKYAVCMQPQPKHDKKNHVEIIDQLEEITFKILQAFRENNRNRLPECIVFFRDGVGEGQFEEVKRQEIDLMRKAFYRIEKNYQPKLSMVIVQKRHKTRFLPQSPNFTSKSGNVVPGLTVDLKISSPYYLQYYQASHAGILGTTRPAKYTLIEDDYGFTEKNLPKLTHFLCHIYARCTRSISIPTPVMYAHLAAFRGKEILFRELDSSSDTDSVLSYASYRGELNPSIKIEVDTTMFFI